MSRFMPALSAVLLAALAAPAGNVIEPARLEIKANFHAAGVYVHVRGDDNRNARAELTYRAGANEAFRPGHPLARTAPGRFAGSIFGLQPGQDLVVRVRFADPDAPTGGAADLTAALQTRSDLFPAGSGRTYCVGPAGNDRDPGTRQRPFGTIQHAVDLAAPGDTIILLAGTYFESVKVRRSGRPDAYITLRADRPASPVRRPAPTVGPRHAPVELAGYAEVNGPWTAAGDGTFAATERRTVGTLCAPKQRLYHHDSLPALKAAEPPLAAGWWQDVAAARLYVRPAGGRAPKAGEVRAGVLPFGLEFEQCGWWIVEDLTFHLFGGTRYSRGVGMDNAWNIVVRHCRFDTMRTGILLRKVRSRDCLIERCELLDSGIWTWPWKACKGHDVEGAGISLRGGEGNVVRHNHVRGPFNGIAASTWGDLKNESLNRDMDIHHNTFTEIGDDPMEPEGACMNVRFWHNRTRRTLQGISLAPITVGPVFVVRDRYVDYKAGAVKVSVQSSGVVWLYHVLGWRNGAAVHNAMEASGPWDNMHFRNCILRGTRYVIEDYFPHPIGCSFDHCCFFSTDRQFVKWANRRYWDLQQLRRAPGFGPHILRVEPYAKHRPGEPAALDARLIDAGVRVPGINDDFRGAAPDIGPDEVR